MSSSPIRAALTGCKQFCIAVCLFAFLLIFGTRVSPAQLLQGTIDGNVTDPSQASIAGATITATDQATGFSRSATTSPAGLYTLASMPPGTYTVTISASGFKTYSRTGVVVAAQTVTRVDASLTVGEVNQSVKVSAEAVMLQSDRADVRSEISSNLLSSVPVPI